MIGINVFQNEAFLANLQNPEKLLQVLYLYIFCTLIRVCVVMILYNTLQGSPYPFTYREATILVWGGLRGAVGLALAIVAQFEYKQAHLTGGVMASLMENDLSISRNLGVIGDDILFFTAMLVLLTLLVNGTSMSTIIMWLRMDAVPTAKVLELRAAFTHVMREGEKKMSVLKKNHFYSGADWKLVRDCEYRTSTPSSEIHKKRTPQLTNNLFLCSTPQTCQTCLRSSHVLH